MTECPVDTVTCDREWPYCITRAVVFGSYVNSDKPRISDLDNDPTDCPYKRRRLYL